ncbi:uncharacterized protein LOC34620138 [Cyclospora cayetanensis]|nr:uncharacterized protein LOC34620138 [Cyclospora cayetanensis]
MTRENEVAFGECGLVFSGSSVRNIGQNRQRQLCFALQGYGFLTRYMKQEQGKKLSWRHNVCLLLSFCGADCHRLYGHPQQTPAAVKALSEAAALAAAQTGDNTQIVTDEDWSSLNEKPSSILNSATIGLEGPSPIQEEPSLNPTNANSGAPASVEAASTQVTLRSSSFSLQTRSKRYDSCQKHFMSRASPGDCKHVYTLDFEAQNEGFGKFFARLALLVGGADIEKVVQIERQVHQYIQAKKSRSLSGNRQVTPKQRELKNSTFDGSRIPAYPDTPVESRGVSYGSSDPHHLPSHNLKIVLEPLLLDGTPMGPFDKLQYEALAPVIQVSIPPNFKALVKPIADQDSSLAHSRRLRGTGSSGSSGSLSESGNKFISAGASINTAAHCKAAAAFMSERPELQWLQEHVFFLHSQG